MKKLFTYIFTTLLAFSVFSVELETRIVPELNIPFQKTYKVGVGGVLSLDLIPASFRLRDTLAISAQGGANFVPVNVIAGKEFDQMKELKSDIAKAEAMLAEIKQENIELLEQRDKLEDPEYVKSYARGIYMLSKEGEQIFYVPSEDDTKQ